jgi:hypothetical protein
MESFGLSQRRASSLIGICRTTLLYRHKPDRDEGLRKRMKELAEQRKRFGYRRLHVLLKREYSSYDWYSKWWQVHTIWRGRFNMKRLLGVVIVLALILTTVVFVIAADIKLKNDYCGGPSFPESWTAIEKKQDTVIAAKSNKTEVRVVIKTQTSVNVGKLTTNRKQCKYDRCLEIYVNNRKIIVGEDVYCALGEVNEGKIFIEDKKNVLIFHGGDGAEGFFVKIEFDHKRVNRTSTYARCSMKPNELFQETIYRVPVL